MVNKARMSGPGATEDTMNHDTSYMNTNYARDKMIESYHREEAEKLTAKEVKGKGRDNQPAPEKEDEADN